MPGFSKFYSFSSGDATSKRPKLSKLELWLKDDSLFDSKAARKFSSPNDSEPSKKDREQSEIIFSLLEDSLSPLKCSLNSKCFTR